MLNEAGQQLGDDTNNAPARACNTRRMLNELRLLPGESAGLGWVGVEGGGGGGDGAGTGAAGPAICCTWAMAPTGCPAPLFATTGSAACWFLVLLSVYISKQLAAFFPPSYVAQLQPQLRLRVWGVGVLLLLVVHFVRCPQGRAVADELSRSAMPALALFAQSTLGPWPRSPLSWLLNCLRDVLPKLETGVQVQLRCAYA